MAERLDVRAVIGRVFEIYVDQAPVLMPAAAVVFVFSGLLSAVLISSSGGLALLALLISFLATTIFTGMVVELVADVQDGRRDASVRGLLEAVVPVLGQLLLIGLVVGVGVLVGLMLIVVPGLILMTIWSVAAPVVVLEQPAGLRALGRSRELVRGNDWRVFGVVLVLGILVIALAAGVQVAADSAGTGVAIVVRVVVGVLTAPLSALAASVLYFELRARQPVQAGLGRPGAPPAPG